MVSFSGKVLGSASTCTALAGSTLTSMKSSSTTTDASCGKLYSLCDTITLLELTPEEREYVEAANVIHGADAEVRIVKARELAEILLQNPNAEVVTYDEYGYALVEVVRFSKSRDWAYVTGNTYVTEPHKSGVHRDIWDGHEVEPESGTIVSDERKL